MTFEAAFANKSEQRGRINVSDFNESEALKKNQYHTAENINTRVLLHQLYSTNKQGFANWIFEHYALQPNQRILELGCGSGGIWKNRSIPDGVQMILSDFSEGMLEAAKKNLKGFGFIEYQVIDAQEIPYDDDTFDIVIANHMLYHVPDIKKALSEIARVLKPDGTFYASTVGLHNMEDLTALLSGFDPCIDFALHSIAQAFGLETGKNQLDEFFCTVDLDRYEDSLHITEADPLADYVLSSQSIGNVNEIISGDRVKNFQDYLTNMLAQKGYIDIKKDAGLFTSYHPHEK
jgi:ubiquinone/menaquinone biosynthesis C-methylase UbiE